MMAAGFVDVSLKNKKGFTAYSLASTLNYSEIATRLSNVEISTLIKYSVTDNGRKDTSLCDKLINLITKYHGDPNFVVSGDSTSGITPFMLIALKGPNDGKAIESIHQKGGNLFSVDGQGWTVLMYAIASNNVATVEKVLTLGKFDRKLFNVVTPDDETPFTVAVDFGNTAIINLLKQHNPTAFIIPNGDKKIEAAPAVNTNNNPKTGLHGPKYSSTKYFSNTNKMNHANIDSKVTTTQQTTTPIKTTPNKYGMEIIEAVIANNLASVKYYVNDGGDVQFVQRGGYNALIHATSKGYTDIIKFLLAHGANPNTAESDGWTPLMFAGFQARMDNIDILLDHGANPCAVNKRDVRADTVAIGNGHKQVLFI